MDRLGRSRTNARRLRVESLEARSLLAGHSAGGSLGLATAAMHHDLPATVAAHVASPIAGASAAASQQIIFSAHLTDTNTGSTAVGNAVFHSGTEHGQTRSQLGVEIEHALASTTYDVAIGGTTLGTITTNANGAGHLVLFSNPRGNQPGLPAGFRVNSADTLTVTAESPASDTLTGTFAAPQPPQVTNLKATLTDSQGGTGKGVALYHSVTKDGTTHSDLEIAVTNATPNSSLDVFVNGGTTSIGTVKTDAHGRGVLHITDASVAIASGDIISVGTLGGTFAATGKK